MVLVHLQANLKAILVIGNIKMIKVIGKQVSYSTVFHTHFDPIDSRETIRLGPK